MRSLQNRKRWLLSCGLVSILLVYACTREPSHEGVTLTDWLMIHHNTPLMDKEGLARSKAALCGIGSRELLPRLIDMAQARDGRLRAWLVAKSIEKDIPLLKRMRSAETLQQLAIAGFDALGCDGAPAIESLKKLLEVPHCGFTALQCLEKIGQPATSTLQDCLTNRDRDFRYHAVFALSRIVEDAESYVDMVKDRIKDSEEIVRFAAVQNLGNQTEVPDSVVPLLIDALADDSTPIVSQAMEALARFGTNALTAIPELHRLAGVDYGNLSAGALRAMISIAPEQALPLLLQDIEAPAVRRRRIAAALLADYPDNPTTVIKALEMALADSDAHVARLANRSLIKLKTGSSPPVGLSTINSLVSPQ